MINFSSLFVLQRQATKRSFPPEKTVYLYIILTVIQRIAFARAVAHKPSMLLADEPTASLDSVTGNQLIQLMLSLCADQHTTLIIATHDSELIAMTDHKMYLNMGEW